MNIEVLIFESCPSWEEALENLEEALDLEGVRARVHIIRVLDDEQATRLNFLGSPSFIVEGNDLWPETRETYHLSCRVYSTPQGMRGAPTVDMLREKIRENKS